MSTHSTAFCATRLGFTRAELLAVIAVVVVLAAALAAMLHSNSKKQGEAAALVRCRDNLRIIGIAFRGYAQDNGGSLPVSATLENPHLDVLHALASARYVSDPRIFYCPAEQQPSLSYCQRNVDAGVIGYFYYSADEPGANQDLSKFLRTGVSWPRALNTHLDPKSWVMSDGWYSAVPTAHASYKKGVNYLMLDGSVGFVPESPRQAFH